MRIRSLVLALLVSCLFFTLFVSAADDAALDAYRQGDYTKALSLWTELAEDGSGTSQYNVGMLHYHGRGVPQDRAAAAAWYARASETGYTRAQYELAGMLEAGVDVERDLVGAHLWFSLSADRRYEGAKNGRKRVAKALDGRQIAESEMRARHLRRAWKDVRRGRPSPG